MRLRFIPTIDVLATIENQSNSHKGISLATKYPVAFDTNPTIAFRVKWKAVNVVAKKIYHQ
jgi:hypothetical protein